MADKIKTFSVHHITKKGRFTFEPKEYSQFKYGCKDIARRYWYELAELFIHNDFKYRDINKPVLVMPSPYQNVPPSAVALMNYFKQRLNYRLYEKSKPSAQEIRIYRELTYNEDFSKMNAEQRMQCLSKDWQYIDSCFTKDKMLLCIDDVKITWTHEKIMRKLLEENWLDDDVTFLYFAEVLNPEIAPSVEDYINHAYVKTLYDLDKIIKGENYLLNGRTIKFILWYNFKGCKEFLKYQKDMFLHAIYSWAIENNYALDERYKKNFEFLEALVHERLWSLPHRAWVAQLY